ncbi:MAG: SDR family oxidoreductase [Anaerolineae bacterium]|nr:SDR family oxidoreductase [Anaerolineae bacterium]
MRVGGNVNSETIEQWYDFSHKTVAITGGAGVLGGEAACALAARGASVAILDRDPALADRLIERMGAGPGCGIAVYADVLKRSTLEQAEAVIREEFGLVDMLLNFAGGNHPLATTGSDASFFDLPEEALRFVFELNVLGTMLPCQVFGKTMADNDGGVILNVSSMNAFRPLTRIPAYSAAKAGVSNFTQWLAVHMAQEYSPRIRVNAIAPGFFMTQQNRFLLIDTETEQLTPRGRAVIDHTPMGRFGLPEDLIGTVLWLLSPASAFVTGMVAPVDGGFNAFGGV